MLIIFGWIFYGGDKFILIVGMVVRVYVYVFRVFVYEQFQNFWILDYFGVISDEMLE